jgi:hypothetical protein
MDMGIEMTPMQPLMGSGSGGSSWGGGGPALQRQVTIAALQNQSATVVGGALGMGPPHGAELAFNLLLHTFVFFAVLTVLYILVISPMETKALATQVQGAAYAGVQAALTAATPEETQALQGMLPALRRLRAVSPSVDPTRELHNQSVLASAWVIVGALGLAFVVAACVMAAARMKLGATMGHVFAENAIMLAILGAIEGGFFMLVASKYVPVMPSVLADTAVGTLKANFPGPPAKLLTLSQVADAAAAAAAAAAAKAAAPPPSALVDTILQQTQSLLGRPAEKAPAGAR